MYTTHKSIVRTIQAGEPDFNIIDGMAVYPRAEIVVMPGAPTNVATTLNWAIAQGYIRCAANIKYYELMWDKLSS
jgi:predicted fused transcriptional regulator/phosphomethylpyrimidine kinase